MMENNAATDDGDRASWPLFESANDDRPATPAEMRAFWAITTVVCLGIWGSLIYIANAS